MSDSSSILLLAESAVADRLSQPSTATVTETSEPFAALEALAEQPYPTVLVALPQPDLPDLLRAIRKLRPTAQVFGLCTPRGEYELRIAGQQHSRMLDDYFLIPPTDSEWERIVATATPRKPAHKAINVGTPAGLSARQVTELIEETAAPARLTRCVAGMAAEACNCEVRWSGAAGARAGVQRLLTIDLDPPQTLWAAEPLEPDENRQQWLSALRTQLPSLAAATRRTEILRGMATTDHLTGAHNRRYFMHFAERMLETVRKRRQRATLLIYDIDDFKIYNDAYGHAAGDEILCETAALMQQITRKQDLVARIGGDEFAVLFCELGPSRQPGSQPLQTAYDLANRFREAVNSHSFQSLGPNASGTLTISGGLATFPWDGFTIASLMQRADEALHAAKDGGKNNIYLIGGMPSDSDAESRDEQAEQRSETM